MKKLSQQLYCIFHLVWEFSTSHPLNHIFFSIRASVKVILNYFSENRVPLWKMWFVAGDIKTPLRLCLMDIGTEYLVFVFSHFLKTRELRFAQFVYFLSKGTIHLRHQLLGREVSPCADGQNVTVQSKIPFISILLECRWKVGVKNCKKLQMS